MTGYVHTKHTKNANESWIEGAMVVVTPEHVRTRLFTVDFVSAIQEAQFTAPCLALYSNNCPFEQSL